MNKTYLRILTYARPFGNVIPRFVVYTLLAIVFNLTTMSFVMPILQVLFDTGEAVYTQTTMPSFEWSQAFLKQSLDYVIYFFTAESSPQTVLTRICVILMVSVLLSNIFNYLSLRIHGLLRARVVRNLRKDVYDKLVALPIGYYTNEKKGDILSRITNDVQEVENSVVSTFNLWFKDPLTIILTFSLLFIVSVQLTVFAIVVLPVSGLIIGEITKRLRKSSTKGQDTLGKILGIIDETVVGLRIVKAFNAEGYIKHKFNKNNELYYKTLRKMENLRRLASPISQVLGVGVVAGTIYYGGMLVLAKDPSLSITPQAFFYYIILLAQVLAPLKSIANAMSVIQRGIASGDRVFELLDQENAIKDSLHPVALNGFKEELEFKNVVFRYESEDVLRGINLTIPQGKTIALVGPSGGGKSTLIDLVPRFYDPQEGEVIIDGHNVKDVSISSLRDLMGVVTQESILFNDTIANNIAFGINASTEEIEQAAKAANAHEFILGTEEGYSTEIGDRGIKLSGGQRQRITIARAILKNPPILLLDEATSALDSESEHLVQEALNNLMKNRTSIIIAHRLSTIQSSDLIVVLKEGQVEEQGTHEELIEKDGLYKKLNEMQSA